MFVWFRCCVVLVRWRGCVCVCVITRVWICNIWGNLGMAAIAQLGERQTEDLKVPGSIPGLGIWLEG